ncbi:MAG: MarR family transcriptional regulator [Candidatus Riflebacteria bacterium]|nr:MarR family transcriptional regulator [Candidatus Riflebacteria bacterium]
MMKPFSVGIIHAFFICVHGFGRKMRPLMEEHGLTGPQFGALKILKNRGAMSPTELSNYLSVTPGNITGIIDRLKKLKYVERRRLSSDRRVLKLAITSEGEKKLSDLLPVWETKIEEIFKEVPLERQEEFLRTLLEIQERLHLNPGSHFEKEAEK